MLFELLRRDLRLHWDVLVIPFLLLVLMMGAVGLADATQGLVGLIFIGTLFVPFMPTAIHLREVHQGTLGDLAALPVSRRALVRLRFLELFLFAGAALSIGHLGTWLVQSLAAHRPVPFGTIDRMGLGGIEVLLLLCFAYPIPFALRWDGKGLVLAFLGLWAALAGLGMLAPRLGGPFTLNLIRGVSDHAPLVMTGLLGLFPLSYLLSVRAFGARDL